MKRTKLWLLAVAFVCSLTSVSAQTTPDGRTVKRITFNQEQVNIEYADGTVDMGVSEMTILNDNVVTGIKSAAQEKQTPQLRRWFTADGRALQGEPRQKGVYIVREKNGMRKTIKQ